MIHISIITISIDIAVIISIIIIITIMLIRSLVKNNYCCESLILKLCQCTDRVGATLHKFAHSSVSKIRTHLWLFSSNRSLVLNKGQDVSLSLAWDKLKSFNDIIIIVTVVVDSVI